MRDAASQPAGTARAPAQPKRLSTSFPVVAIGASVGGQEALELLVERLQPSGTAFMIMQHLSPRFPSSLPELLARRCALPLVTPEAYRRTYRWMRGSRHGL